MPSRRNPKVGVIADTTFLRHVVSHALESEGYEIVANTAPNQIDFEMVSSDELDVWLVELEDQDQWVDVIDALLDHAHAPIFFGDGQAPPQTSIQFPRWQRRIFTKISDIVGEPAGTVQQTEEIQTLQNLPQLKTTKKPAPAINHRTRGEVPEQVWVLGASLGGPAAVKLFLDQLPSGLPVAFVLAQHIDGGFQDVLAQVLGRHNQFNVSVAQDGQFLASGDVIIAPVSVEIEFANEGEIVMTERPWNGPYAPSIDQVMLSIGEAFADKSGAIIFSGMGNDGAIAGPQMRKKGGLIWAQSSDSCANSSQPDSVRDTGCVGFSGTPQALAFQLVERIRKERKRCGH